VERERERAREGGRDRVRERERESHMCHTHVSHTCVTLMCHTHVSHTCVTHTYRVCLSSFGALKTCVSDKIETLFVSPVGGEGERERQREREGDRERAAKDISLKLETQVCTTNPEVPPRKAEFPFSTKLRIGGWGGPWVANIDYQHCLKIFYLTSFFIQFC